MSQIYFALTFFLTFSCYVEAIEENYYWRPYMGTIPQDAVIAGQDVNNKNVYIGRSYFGASNGGVVTIEIRPDSTDFYIVWSGSNRASAFKEILCGAQENFDWIPANNTHLHVTLLNKKTLLGGWELGGFTHIGRVHYAGGVRIGKINSWVPGNAIFYWMEDGNLKYVNDYEVMIYKDKYKIDPRSNCISAY